MAGIGFIVVAFVLGWLVRGVEIKALKERINLLNMTKYALIEKMIRLERQVEGLEG